MAITRILPSLGNPAFPQLDYNELIAAGVHVPEFIEKGFDDFSFDISSPELFQSRTSLFAINTSGKEYSTQDNTSGKYLLIDEGQNGLLTNLTDTREITYGGVFNYRSSDPDSSQMLMGSSSNNSGSGGEQVYISQGGAIVNSVRGYAANSAVSTTVMENEGLFPSSGLFIFLAVSSRITSGDETETTLFVGSSDPFVSVSGGVKTLATRKIAIGNAYRDGVFSVMPCRVARAFVAPGARTVTELTAMYQRAKVVAARRGVTVW